MTRRKSALSEKTAETSKTMPVPAVAIPPSASRPSNMPARSRRTSLSRSSQSGRAKSESSRREVAPRAAISSVGDSSNAARSVSEALFSPGRFSSAAPIASSAQPRTASSARSRPCPASEARSAAIRWWRRRSRSAAVSVEPGTVPSGFIACGPPGRSSRRVIESASASASYSRFGSTMKACRPTPPRPKSPTCRARRHLTAADFPLPGSPKTITFGLSRAPSA